MFTMSTIIEDNGKVDNMGNDLISQSEAARMLGTSRQYVNKLVNNGKLNHSEIAGTKFVYAHEVEKMMKNARTR